MMARRSVALTLIELLTSVAIGLVLTVLATVSFMQIRKTLQRVHIRLEMHASARFLFQEMSESVGSLQQDGAMWLETTHDDGSQNGIVSLTFLRGRVDEKGNLSNQGDYVPGEQYGGSEGRCSDLAWCCWKWDQHRQILYTGENSRPHQFRVVPDWNGPYGFGHNSQPFLYMPQPLRLANPYPTAAAAGSSQAALSGNRYGSPDFLNDLGDYQDLQQQLAPVLRNVSNCVLELVLADGSIVDGDVSQDRTVALDGCYVDGRGFVDNYGSQPYRKRPRLVRILVDMRDPVSGVTQSFSFSFQPPGPLPLQAPQGEQIP